MKADVGQLRYKVVFWGSKLKQSILYLYRQQGMLNIKGLAKQKHTGVRLGVYWDETGMKPILIRYWLSGRGHPRHSPQLARVPRYLQKGHLQCREYENIGSDFRHLFPGPHYVIWELWMLGHRCHWWDLDILPVPWVKTQSGCLETGSLLPNCLLIELLYIYLILPGKQLITIIVLYKSWSVLWIKKGFCWELEHLKNLGLYLTPPHWVGVERRVQWSSQHCSQQCVKVPWSQMRKIPPFTWRLYFLLYFVSCLPCMCV